MSYKQSNTIREKIAATLFRSRWSKVLSVMAGIVVFCTTYAMILPAITMSSQDANCGFEEHEHVAECYNEEGELICGMKEHIHTLACYADLHADIENEDLWRSEIPDLTGDRNEDVVAIASSLLGYRESDKNYLVSSDDQTEGYTRFGHWYGQMVDQVLRDTADEVKGEIVKEIDKEIAEDTTGIAVQRFYEELDAFAAQNEEKKEAAAAEGKEYISVEEPADIMTGIADYASGNITPERAHEIVSYIALLRTDEVAARIPAKIAEKMIGINQSEIDKGHVEKLKNNLPASSYKKWDAMFVSYVLNYAQITDFGAESDAGNWAGALTASGKYVDAAGYVPAAGDLIFFIPYAGADIQVGIVSHVNTNLFGLGDTVDSISVILGDSNNEVEEIKVAVDGYTEGDVIFESINGYGVLTPRAPEEEVPEDTSRADSIADFFAGIFSSEEPADEAVADEAASLTESVSDESENIAAEDSATEMPGDETADTSFADSSENVEENSEIADSMAVTGKPDEKAEDNPPSPDSIDGTSKDTKSVVSNSSDSKTTDDKTNKNEGGNTAPAEDSDSKKTDSKAADDQSDKKTDSKAADDQSDTKTDSKAADDQSDKQTDIKTEDPEKGEDNGSTTALEDIAGDIADDTQHIIGATADNLDVTDEEKNADTEIAIVQADVTEDGSELIMNWLVTADLPDAILPAGVIIRIDMSTGKYHAMTPAQAQAWAGSAILGGKDIAFADSDDFEITFIGNNGHLYTWADVQAMNENVNVSFCGVHVKTLNDIDIEDGNNSLSFSYTTTARIADANIGHNYYVSKAGVDGRMDSTSYIYENGEPVTVDQDWILRDANLDETGHAADETDEEDVPGANPGQATEKENAAYKGGVLTAEGRDYTVTLSYGADACIPEVAKLYVKEIRKGSTEYNNYISDAKDVLGIAENDDTELLGRFFDIKIMTKAGEYEPKAAVKVEITYKNAVEVNEYSEITAVHFEEDGAAEIETEAVSEDGDLKSIGFEADSFSVYGVVYTVDSVYEGYVFSVPANAEITLFDLAEAVGIVDVKTNDDSKLHTGNYTYCEFSSAISDIEASEPTVAVSPEDDWKITTTEDFTGAVLTISLNNRAKYVINMVKDGELLTATAGGYTVNVEMPETMPEGNYTVDVSQTTLNVKESSETIAALEESLSEELDNGITKTAHVEADSLVAMDITVYKDGEEIHEFDDSVKVEITPAEGNGEENVKPAEEIIAHIGEDGIETIEVSDGTFETKGFSKYVISYTVDFEWNGYTFTIPGGTGTQLSDLMRNLHIDYALSDVENVIFDRTDLLNLEYCEDEREYTVAIPVYADEESFVYPDDGNSDSESDEEDTEKSEDEERTSTVLKRTVPAGDWIITSVASFDTYEELIIELAGGDTVVIGVTDPVTTPVSGNKYNLTDAANITLTYDSSYETNEQERNASFDFRVDYTLDEASLKTIQRGVRYNPWFPFAPWSDSSVTFTYDFSTTIAESTLSNTFTGDKKSLYVGSGRNRKKVGTVDFDPTGKAVITITDIQWFMTRSNLNGFFEFSVSVDENQAKSKDEDYFSFPGVANPVHITFKSNITTEKKTLDAVDNEDGSYTFNYTAQITSPTDLNSLQFVDTLSGMQKLVPPVIFDNNPVSVTETSTGFTCDLGPMTGSDNPHTITYTTRVTAEQYAEMQNGGSSWETNHADWKINGDKIIPGGDTSYSINKPIPPSPDITKTSKKADNSDANGATLSNTDEITYEIVIGNAETELKGLWIFDEMTDVQDLIEGSQSVTIGGQAAGADEIAAMFASYNNDGRYSTNNTRVYDYRFPSDYYRHGPIVITYRTKLIDQQTATDNSIYGDVSVKNTATEGSGWKSSTTVSTVPYTKQTETKITKSMSADANGDGLYEPGETITYTLVVGDGTTLLDGAQVTDNMSRNQHLNVDSFTVSGNNVALPEGWHVGFDPAGYGIGNYEAQIIDFKFPAGTGNGPVIITYTANVISQDEAAENGIYGQTAITNNGSTGTDSDGTSGTGNFGEKPNPGDKTYTIGDGTTPYRTEGTATIQPTDTDPVILHYTAVFGGEDTTLAGKNILDEMTDIQKLTGDVTVTLADRNVIGAYTLSNGTTIEIENGVFTMPAASNGWDNNGVTWNYFDDNSYNKDLNVRTYSFTFPSEFKYEGADITGPVTVTYDAALITSTEAADAGIVGAVTANNKTTSDLGSHTTTMTPTYPSNLDHNPKVTKEFDEWANSENSTYWTIRIEADETSTYPITDVTLTENVANGQVWYSTEYPFYNYSSNSIADIDFLGATITTDSGLELQAGQDYTIDKKAGSFHFDSITEPVTIRIAIKSPVPLVNTYKQHNEATISWHKDQWNTGRETVTAETQRVYEDIDLIKSGEYDEDTRILTYKVILNPYQKTLDPDSTEVTFTDILPDGVELLNYSDNSTTNPSIYVSITGGGFYYSYENDEVTIDGDTVTARLDVTEMYGTPITSSGLSGKTYTIDYKTRLTEDKWNEITSSLTGVEYLNNTATVTDNQDHTYTASDTEKVEYSEYLDKIDATETISGTGTNRDGYVAKVDKYGHYLNSDDEVVDSIGAAAKGEQLLYKVKINENGAVLNSGKHLTLTDRVDTNMELDTDSFVLYDANGDEIVFDTATRKYPGKYSDISISYNDDTRYFTISGIPDKTFITISYLTTVRTKGEGNYVNTATLVGGGSHSDTVVDSHKTQEDAAGIEGTGVRLSLKKIDENNISQRLPGATFELYECELAIEQSGKLSDRLSWEQWSRLISDLESGDEAILNQIKSDYKIVKTTKVGEGITNENGMIEFPTTVGGMSEQRLYYWVETASAPGYKVSSTEPHYFVLYEEVEREDSSHNVIFTRDQRKEVAWALDDATQMANGISVASMASETEWNVGNVGEGYTSISASKSWVGDYNNQYETRPENGIQLNLYRIDADGKKELMADLSPVTLNVYTYEDANGRTRSYWPSYTWYKLADADSSGRPYKYTVEELPVDGYITTYSDNGEGRENGSITVTNTYIPKNTEINVKKKFEPENGAAKPEQIKVNLYQITVDAETGKKSKPVLTDHAAILNESTGWSAQWKGLPTTESFGNVLLYTVMEDVESLHKDGFSYAPVYSDSGEGVVSASADSPLTITNVLNAAGSLKITKKVTVNGESVSDTAADGIYTFKLYDSNGQPATYQHNHASECLEGNAPNQTINTEKHNEYLVPDITIEIKNGTAQTVKIDNLEEGTYTVTELTPTNGTSVVGEDSVQVKVVGGKTTLAQINGAEFTNNINKSRVKVSKNWVNADGTTRWPSGIEVQVTLKNNGETATRPSAIPAGEAWEAVQYLNSSHPSYIWDNLDESGNYTVEETGLCLTSAPETIYPVVDGYTSIDGKTYKVMTSMETVDVENSDAKEGTATVTNIEQADVEFDKTWTGTIASGTGADNPENLTIKVKLQRDKTISGTTSEDAEFNAEQEEVSLTAQNVKSGDSSRKFYKSWDKLPSAEVMDGHTVTYTYKVVETGVYLTSDLSTNLLDNAYLSAQTGDTEIENIYNRTSIQVKKAWVPVPDHSWSIDATLQRRLAKKLVGTEWIDLSETDYPFETFDHEKVTISGAASENNVVVTVNELDKYVFIDGERYEYDYNVKEENVAEAYTSNVTKENGTIVITNTQVTEGYAAIKVNKIFKDKNGNIVEEGDLPEGTSADFTLKRYKVESGGTQGGGTQSGENTVTVMYGYNAIYGVDAERKIITSRQYDGTDNVTLRWNDIESSMNDTIQVYAYEDQNNSGYYVWVQKFIDVNRDSNLKTGEITFNIENKDWWIVFQHGVEDDSYGQNLLNAGLTLGESPTEVFDGNFSQEKTFPDDFTYDPEAKSWVSSSFVVPVDGYSYYIEESDITPANITNAAIYETSETNPVDEEHRITLTQQVPRTITATNIVPPTTQVQVKKVWSDGDSAHTDDSVNVQLYKSNDSGGNSREAVGDEIVLNKDKNWAYTWENLPAVELDGQTDIYYFVVESSYQSSAAEVTTTYQTNTDAQGNKIIIITNTPTYRGSVALQKTYTGLPDYDSLTPAQKNAVDGLEFEITTGAGEGLKYVKIDTSKQPSDDGYVVEVPKADFDTAAEGAYRNIKYSDLTEEGHKLTFASNVVSGTTYNVSEISPGNLPGLKDSYSLLVDDSMTSGSNSAPKGGTNTIELANVYDEIKGSIKVNKQIYLNGSLASDDVAAAQRFRLGLEFFDTSQNSWVVVTDPTDEKHTQPWIQTVVIGSGSTASATFNELSLGKYRAYEVDQNGNRISIEAVATINGIAWSVSRAGTHYTYSGNQGDENRERETNNNTTGEVTLIGDDGGVDDMAPRNGEITITNNKTEKGRIEVNKTLLYNGQADSDSKTFYFGLYTDANATNAVKDPSDSTKNWVIPLETADADNPDTEDVDERGKGTAVFSPIDYDTTYYVFELEGENGQPIKSANGTINGVTYTVVRDTGGQVTNHSAQTASTSVSNAQNERGSLTVTKTLLVNGETPAASDVAGRTFKVGLFRDVDGTRPYPNRTATITIGKDAEGQDTGDNTGSVTFTSLEFPNTYFVFEIDDDGQPVGEAYKYQVLSPQPTVGNGIKIEKNDPDKNKLTDVRNNEVKTNLKATKQYLGANGTPLTPWPCDFDLVLSTNHTGAQGVHMPAADELTKTVTQGEPTATFGDIYFTKAGTFTFEIKEKIPEDTDKELGVIYDNSVKTVTVEVKQKTDGSGALEIESTGVKYPDEDNNPSTNEAEVVLTNRVKETSVKVTKEWSGSNSQNVTSVTYKLYQTYMRDAKDGLEESERKVTSVYTGDLPSGSSTRTLGYREASGTNPAGWETATLEHLPKYVYNEDDSKWYEVSYYVEETITQDDKYAATYRLGGNAGAEGVETASDVTAKNADNALTIINKDTAKEFKFRKVWMDSNENTANSVEWVKDITVKLYGKKNGASDSIVNVYNLTNQSSQSDIQFPYTVTVVPETVGSKSYTSYEFEFTGLPAEYDSFYVLEDELDGYSTTYRIVTGEGNERVLAEERRENAGEGNYIINSLVHLTLPSTGGIGTSVFYLLGFILVAIAAMGFLVKKNTGTS